MSLASPLGLPLDAAYVAGQTGVSPKTTGKTAAYD
jgi:hypothetical protein